MRKSSNQQLRIGQQHGVAVMDLHESMMRLMKFDMGGKEFCNMLCISAEIEI